MPSGPPRPDSPEFFRERYGRPRLEGARQVDRSVLGHDAGLNGYTTASISSWGRIDICSIWAPAGDGRAPIWPCGADAAS
jgi:hypothetical protein